MPEFNFKNAKIYYEVYGSGIPVLLIHGWGVDHNLMAGAFESVFSEQKKYKRFYIDLPGMGKSSHGDIVNSDDILEMLHCFATTVIKEKFIIAGQSYGGLLTRGYVNKYCNELLGIMLLCPLVIPGYRMGRHSEHFILERDEKFLESLTKAEYDDFSFMNVLLTKEVYDRYVKEIASGLKAADFNYLNNTLKGDFSFNVDELNEPVELPCLIVTARQDTEVGYEDQFDLLKIYKNATYAAINKAGHNLSVEQPVMVKSIISAWLNSMF